MAEQRPIAPGQHSPERLDETLKYFSDAGMLDAEAAVIPRPKRTAQDPYVVAKFVAEKMRRWFEDCMIDEGIVSHGPIHGVSAAMEVVFAVELFGLNILNADNIPATPEQVSAAREAAFNYFAAHRGK